MVDTTKITAFVNALNTKFENKQANKKSDISGDFSDDAVSYPTVQAVKSWVGTQMSNVGSIILGETSDTAYRGDRGKAAYDHSQLTTGNPHNVTKTDVGLSNVTNVAQAPATHVGDDTHLTSAQKTAINSISGKANSADLATVATSGDYDDLTNKPSIPTKTSDLTNDGDGTNVFITNDDSRLTDARTPTSHTHGQVTNDGKITSTAVTVASGDNIVITDASDSSKVKRVANLLADHIKDSTAHTNIGSSANATQASINTSIDTALGTKANSSALTGKEDTSNKVSSWSPTTTNTSYPSEKLVKDSLDNKVDKVSGKGLSTNDFTNTYKTALDNLSTNLSGKDVTVEKLGTAESGYIASYVVKQNGSQVGATINIPKDYLVKSATTGTVTTANDPVTGYVVGDRYIDFVINTKDNSGTDEHLYVLVSDLVDEYLADESTLTLSGNTFSVKDGGVTKTKLATAVQTSLGYADAWNSSAAKGITSANITAWNNKSNLTTADVDTEIEAYLTAITTALE